MTREHSDTFTRGALIIGGGIASFAALRWLLERPAAAATRAQVPTPRETARTAAVAARPTVPPISPPPRAASPSTSTGRPPAASTHRWDAIFERHGGGLPVAFLRALASRESDLNPDSHDGPAWGLLQVVEVVRRDYNARHGTHHTREDLLDPAINVTIASELLRAIIASYQKHHPEVPNLQADWGNPRFTEMLIFGWLCARAHNQPYVKCGVM